MAVTTVHDGRTNGLMVLSGGPVGIIPEAPRASVSITKDNFSHDLVHESGIFILHVLGSSEELIDRSINIIRILGGSSGRDGDKLGPLRTKTGASGAPILVDALAYAEVRVTASLDNDENTIFVGDVVAAARLGAGRSLDVATAWPKLGAWTDEYAPRLAAQIDHARELRGRIGQAGS